MPRGFFVPHRIWTRLPRIDLGTAAVRFLMTGDTEVFARMLDSLSATARTGFEIALDRPDGGAGPVTGDFEDRRA